MMTTMQDAKTMPPGPADEAALEHARELVASGRDRSAVWWVTVERAARDLGLAPDSTKTGG